MVVGTGFWFLAAADVEYARDFVRKEERKG